MTTSKDDAATPAETDAVASESATAETEAMWRMLQQPVADDYVIATGRTHSIRDLLDAAFGVVGIEDWTGHVEQDPALLRPAEIQVLVGDPTKARTVLGWEPGVQFVDLVRMMVEADLKRL